MISGYENYDPSDYEYMYDEDRLWELTFDVIASSKEEAMKNLLNDYYTKERQIVDEKEVKIFRIYGNPDHYDVCETSYYTYVIVSEKDVRPGVDFVEDNIFITDVTFTKDKWCDDGIEKTTSYFFNDGFKLVKINISATGWSEGKTLLIDSNNKSLKKTLEKRKSTIIDDLAGEYWNDVVGYEGIYKVSNLSRLKTVSREKKVLRNGKYVNIQVVEKFIKEIEKK